jgi:hypothetical protein
MKLHESECGRQDGLASWCAGVVEISRGCACACESQWAGEFEVTQASLPFLLRGVDVRCEAWTCLVSLLLALRVEVCCAFRACPVVSLDGVHNAIEQEQDRGLRGAKTGPGELILQPSRCKILR